MIGFPDEANTLSATLIDGKAIAAEMREATARRASALRELGRAPTLAAVMIGEDPAAVSYARSQAKQAQEVGIDYRAVSLPPDTAVDAAWKAIAELNADPVISGIMLYLPVPESLDGFALQQRIAPEKDVEGVGAANLGLVAMGRDALPPCTAAAAFKCLESTGTTITGLDVVIVGRSAIVGKPLAMLLLNANATITQCHTRTRDLAAHTRRADVLFVAAGKAGLVGAEHVKPGAIVIDVGTHRVPDERDAAGEKMKTVGDVRFDEVAPIAKSITPVPGGVGPVTVAQLMANAVAACERGLDGDAG